MTFLINFGTDFLSTRSLQSYFINLFNDFYLGINFLDRKSTRLNSSYANISYAVFCLKKKKGDKDVLRGSKARPQRRSRSRVLMNCRQPNNYLPVALMISILSTHHTTLSYELIHWQQR